MFHDALFQLGMGSVLLNASQKEETFVARALKACVEAFCVSPGLRVELAATAVMDPFRPGIRRRGNSAKAPILRVGSAAVPSRS